MTDPKYDAPVRGGGGGGSEARSTVAVCGLREPSIAVIPTSMLDEQAIVDARAAEAMRRMSSAESAPIMKVEADGCAWVSAQWLIDRERARTYALKRKLEETEAALAQARATIERMSPVGWRPAVCRCARLPRAHDWIESACTGRSGL